MFKVLLEAFDLKDFAETSSFYASIINISLDISGLYQDIPPHFLLNIIESDGIYDSIKYTCKIGGWDWIELYVLKDNSISIFRDSRSLIFLPKMSSPLSLAYNLWDKGRLLLNVQPQLKIKNCLRWSKTVLQCIR